MSDLLRKPSAAPPRIPALSRLPLFFDLAAKRVVIAGGSAEAAAKAELLAAAGANVHIFVQEPSEDMRALLERGTKTGSLTFHKRAWDLGDFSCAALAFGDCKTDDEAAIFLEAGRAAGVPSTTTEGRGTRAFEFGEVVNRSPVVIGVSTISAAPILAENIKRRIETLLPKSLSSWAALASNLREQVRTQFSEVPEQQAIWERFANRAMSGANAPRNFAAISRLINAMRLGELAEGRVTIVGAGPGDPELLTVKAVRTLQAADVILFDDLVSEEVLEIARPETRRISVGKRARAPSCAQTDINALLIELAREGKHVVRLKSGDPMIFARAGEEIEELRKADIPVEVVAGVSAANALAASLAVSLTHRDYAQSVRFVTGQSRSGELQADADWRGLADGRTSLVFYMAGRTAHLIATRLIEHGLSPSTPAVIAWSVSRKDQTHRAFRLQDLAGLSPLEAQGRPAILCIGAAFAHATAGEAMSTAHQQLG